MTITLWFAILLGFLFGFALNRTGAAFGAPIVGMLRLRDLTLMKSILFAIGFATLGAFILLQLGLLDPSHLSVKSSYIGVPVGGVLLGIGWAIAAYCPGTAVAAAGAGDKRAMAAIAGGLVGAFLFTLAYGSLKGTFLFNKIGTASTLAQTGNDKYEALFTGVPGFVVAGVIGLALMGIAWILPQASDGEKPRPRA